VARDSIDLTVEQNLLTVHAVRSRPNEATVEMIVAERPQGTFSRQLFLGQTLDTDHIDAQYSDGVLRLSIPVAERAKPRKVEIGGDDQEPIEVNA
jgi:HSP20 family protein